MSEEVGKREVAEAKTKAPTTGGRGRVEANSSSKRGACHQATRTDETSGLASSPVRSPEVEASASATARFPTRDYAIMREPGPAARRSAGAFGYARPRRMEIRSAGGEKEALGDFYADKYLARGHRQYAGSRFEWRGENGRAWRPDDGAEARGRRWRLVVVLKNGAYVHEVAYEAWSR